MSVSQQQRKKKNDGQNIKVFVRVRPMGIEKATKNYCCIECQNNKEVIVQERPFDKYTKKFSFDKVFPQCSKQEDIYKTVAKPLVEEVLNGFNCTIFAYGQTGTGKTYTMEGEYNSVQMNFEENSSTGIVPRCINQLFDELRIQQNEFTMRVSFLELYNEELFDLLSANDDLTKLRLYEDSTRKGSCIIQGLEEVLVRSKTDVYSIIKKGSAKRQTASTLMNAHSSRSHTVFTVTVHIKETAEDGNEMLKTGKLHLVDLAGSENIGRSGAIDKRAREAGNINQSLLTVGRVITSLVEKAPHIPYRESKLTRLLQDALGGRTKTSIIATISPSSYNIEETLSTLDYAFRAKNIQNRPEANQKLNKKELITEYTAEIDRLQRDLLATRERNGVYLANENYRDITATIESQSKELLDKITYIRVIEEEMEKLKETFNEVNCMLKETSNKLIHSESHLTETKETLRCTQKLLTITANERDEQSYLMTAHKTTETKLIDHGKDLILVADITTSDIDKLHCKIDRKRQTEADNKQIGDDFSLYLKGETDQIRNNLQNVLDTQRTCLNSNISKLGSIVMTSDGNVKEMLAGFNDLSSFASHCLTDMTNFLTYNEERHKHDIGKYVNKMAADGLEIEKDYEQVFKDKVMPFITSLNFILSSFDCIILNLKEENDNMMTEIENCCDAVNKEQTANLQLLDSQIESLFDGTRKLSVFHKQQVDKLKEDEDNHIKALDNIMQSCLAEKEKRLMKYTNYSDIKNRQNEADQVTEGKYNKMCEIHSKIATDMSHNQTLIKSAVNNCYQLHEEASSAYSEKSESLKLQQIEVCEYVVQHDNRTDNAFTKLYKNAADFRDTLCQSIDLCTGQLKDSMQTLTTKLMENLNNKAVTLKMEHHSKAESMNGVCDDISYTLEKVGIDHAQQDVLIDDCSQRVLHLFNQEIKKDVPTGETPIRKSYNYLKILPETSPHEKLLSRFRRHRSSAAKIPVPPTELEDSLQSTSSSTVNSESDSCDKIFMEPLLPAVKRSGSFRELPTFLDGTNNIIEEKLCPLVKSSSASCIGEFKENKYQKKKEPRIPSEVPVYNTGKLRARKILGPKN